jgi:hypothetical protein
LLAESRRTWWFTVDLDLSSSITFATCTLGDESNMR